MLAPTRELVAELNDRARTHRLDGQTPERTVHLADGSTASAGDTVITRANDRQLRLTGTDWVKNGDRWHVTTVHPTGALTLRHTTSGCSVDLPPDYVRAFVDLGYATTIHTAQGVTADASHTLLTGQESRQLAYTAVTRGKAANHLYLEVVGDGEEHNVIRPEYVHPLTATDLLERILARDESAQSAHTTRRLAEDPATLLGQAAARYVDSLYVGAEQLLGPQQVARLDRAADLVVPDLTQAAAWPTLRAHLLLLAAQDGDPVTHLRAAAGGRELDTAGDVAAVLDWRLDDTGLRNAGTGPLPWLPGIPASLREDPQWGPYLAARAAQVRDLAQQVTEHARSGRVDARSGPAPANDAPTTTCSSTSPCGARPPVYPATTGARPAHPSSARPPPGTSDHSTPAWPPATPRPSTSGAPCSTARSPTPPGTRSSRSSPSASPALSRAGLDAPQVLRRALADGALPDDHAAAALWWRISGRLSPAVAAQAESDHHLTTPWTPRLADLVGAGHGRDTAGQPLVAGAGHHRRPRHRPRHHRREPARRPDHRRRRRPLPGTRLAHLHPQRPRHRRPRPVHARPRARWQRRRPVRAGRTATRARLAPPTTSGSTCSRSTTRPRTRPRPNRTSPTPTDPFDDPAHVEAYLTLAAAARAHATTLPPTDRMIEAQASREFDAAMAPVSPARILELNRLATDYYVRQLPRLLGPDLPGRTAPHRPHRRPARASPATPPPAGPTSWTTCADTASPTSSSPSPAWPPSRAPVASSTASATASSSRSPASPLTASSNPSASSAAATPTRQTRPADRSTSTPPTRPSSTRARSSTRSAPTISTRAPRRSSSKAPLTPLRCRSPVGVTTSVLRRWAPRSPRSRPLALPRQQCAPASHRSSPPTPTSLGRSLRSAPTGCSPSTPSHP